MFSSISISSIYVLDQDEALDFYVGKLGFEVGTDADLGFMRWLTVRVPGDSRELLLENPGPPSMDDATGEQARELISKGAGGGWFVLNTDDAQATYDALKAMDVDLTEEPTQRDYGIDFGLRDPFGNRLRITQPVAQPAR
ncbi:MAG TPA: VOC family protein [Baekduia sp.]|jgi:catechol 2,3-dioxygenase-like lactoylglutathione lyase family enzyme